MDDIFDWMLDHEMVVTCVSYCVGAVIGAVLSWFVVVPFLNNIWPM